MSTQLVSIEKVEKSTYLLGIRTILSSTMAAAALMLPYYQGFNLGQSMIGITQAWFTIVLLVLTLPAGRLADRTSRRGFLIAGDITAAAGFLVYANIHGAPGILVAETILAIGAALSTGADDGLYASYTSRFNNHRERVTNFWGWIGVFIPATQLGLVVLAGLAAVHFDNLRIAFVIAGMPYVVSAVLGFFMLKRGDEVGGPPPAKVKKGHRSLSDLLRDAWQWGVTEREEMWVALKNMRQDTRLMRFIAARVIAFRMTTPLNFVLTALMLAAGVPVHIIAFAWAAKPAAVILGSLTARFTSRNVTPFNRFVWPTIAIVASLVAMAINLNKGTVALYAVIGFAEGWFGPSMRTLTQLAAPQKDQSMVGSVFDMLAQVVYLPLVLLVNIMASRNLTWTLWGCAIAFTIVGVIMASKLLPLKLPDKIEQGE